MDWIAQLLAALFDAILSRYGELVGKTVAKDAPRKDGVLRRAGNRIREWMHSRDNGQRGKPDESRAGVQDQGVRDD